MTVSNLSSVVRRFASAACVGLALSSAFTVSEARADFTFNLGNLFVDSNTATGNILISPTLPAGTYTSYELSTNWVAGSGDPFSNEAIWALANESPLTASTVFYADPGISANSLNNGNPVTLNWSGNFDTPYSSGPLYFLTLQTFGGSNANWNNTTLTLKTAPVVIPPPPSTNFAPPTTAGGVYSSSGVLAAGQVVWYDFIYGGNGFTVDTLGSALSNGNDTELGLYNALGTLLATNDDIDFANDVFESRLNFQTGAGLTVGERYYIAVGAFNTSFLSGFNVTSASTATGTFQLNVTVIPEAGTSGLLGLGGLLGAGVAVVSRRRKSA